MLKIDNLSFSYGKRAVLDNVSFNLKEGEVLALLGRNGSGKTTLLRLLLGFLKPDSGSIYVHEKDIHDISNKELASEIAYIPQYSSEVFPSKAIDAAVMGRANSIGLFSKPSKKDYEKAEHYMEMMGISHLRNRNMGRISGGERQLVLISRALTQEAKILLLDEPTSSLDYTNQLMVLEAVQKLSEKGYSALFSTHNPEQALMFSTSILLLDKGISEYYETPKPLIDGKRLSSLYDRELYVSEVDTGTERRIVCLPK